MAASTPARRVLSDLNVNTPIAYGAGLVSGSKPSSFTKPTEVAEISVHSSFKRGASYTIYEQGIMADSKQHSGASDDALSEDEHARKRFKTSETSHTKTSNQASIHIEQHREAGWTVAVGGERDIYPDGKTSSLETEASRLAAVLPSGRPDTNITSWPTIDMVSLCETIV
jgi:hypothetical protein